MFRVIIAGSRSFEDYDMLVRTMDMVLRNITDEIQVVCGMAAGADTLGERYAKERRYQIAYFPADWKKYGRAAGFNRNVEMAKHADALVAFWDGKSKGTKHMLDIAQRYGLRVRLKPFQKQTKEVE